jgi:hypothetical protein
MVNESKVSRRLLIKSSVVGFCFSQATYIFHRGAEEADAVPRVVKESKCSAYPAIDDAIVEEVVSLAHFDFDKLKKIVDVRPELARANWDWGFGDRESAIGAASHVGRSDIIRYLLSKGAIPDIFTYASLGYYDLVKAMIETSPFIENTTGPHGITLLQHSLNAMAAGSDNKDQHIRLQNYLEALGEPWTKTYASEAELTAQKYVGNYKYGSGDCDGFTIRFNMRKMLSLGKLGKSGGALYKLAENKFTYNGAPSVLIEFVLEGEQVKALKLNEPGFSLTAIKQ